VTGERAARDSIKKTTHYSLIKLPQIDRDIQLLPPPLPHLEPHSSPRIKTPSRSPLQHAKDKSSSIPLLTPPPSTPRFPPRRRTTIPSGNTKGMPIGCRCVDPYVGIYGSIKGEDCVTALCGRKISLHTGRLSGQRTEDYPPEPVLGDSVMSGRLLISGRRLILTPYSHFTQCHLDSS